MIGTPISFSQPEIQLYKNMCALLAVNFGQYTVTNQITVGDVQLQGKPLAELAAMLTTTFAFVASTAPEKMQDSDELSALLSKLNVSSSKRNNTTKKTTKRGTPADITAQKQKEAYDTFHRRLYLCTTLCTVIFKELYHYDKQATAQNNQALHQVCSFFILLAAICNYNMAVYQTHPVHEKLDQKRMRDLFLASKNWIVLLESYHLNYGQSDDYNNLRKLFVQRTIDFQNQFYRNPDWIDLFAEEMKLPLEPKELVFHVVQQNQRAKRLGLPFDGHVIIPKADTLYMPSSDALRNLYERIRMVCLDPSQMGRRAQFLLYYNSPYGNVDVIDVSFNQNTQTLQIVNIHTSNSCAQHELLMILYSRLMSAGLPFQLLACQATLGQRTQNTAAYALKLSELLSKQSFAALFSHAKKVQPTFSDEAHDAPQELRLIPEIGWFPIEALGDKALLLHENAATLPALKDKMPEYTLKYGLAEMLSDDPETAFNYADSYRRRLAFRYFTKNPFAKLSYQQLKDRLQPKDDAHMLRLAATERASAREFEFLVDHFKTKQQEQCLHERAASGFTPLLWCLKKKYPKKAALLLSATAFAAEELADDKNDDKQSAKQLFAKAKDPATTDNPVLRKFLK